MKITVFLICFLISPLIVYPYTNYGKIEFHDLGFIAGNSMTENYDYVILFKLKNNFDMYRVIGDVDYSIKEMGDNIFKIGIIDRFLIASVQSSKNIDNLDQIAVLLSRSTKQGRVCRIFSYYDWNASDDVNKVMFGEKHVSDLCIN